MLLEWVILGRFLWFLHHFKANFKGYLMVQTILQAFWYLYFIYTFTVSKYDFNMYLYYVNRRICSVIYSSRSGSPVINAIAVTASWSSLKGKPARRFMYIWKIYKKWMITVIAKYLSDTFYITIFTNIYRFFMIQNAFYSACQELFDAFWIIKIR